MPFPVCVCVRVCKCVFGLPSTPERLRGRLMSRVMSCFSFILATVKPYCNQGRVHTHPVDTKPLESTLQPKSSRISSCGPVRERKPEHLLPANQNPRI